MTHETMTKKTYRVVIVDRLGAPRVWGEGETHDIAETRAWAEFQERGYMRRVDLRPFKLRDDELTRIVLKKSTIW